MSNSIKKLIPLFLVLSLVAIFLPAGLILAAGATSSGLVQCGKGNTGPEDCDLLDLISLVKAVIDFIVKLAVVVAVGLIVYAGIWMVTHSTSPGEVAKAWGILKNVLIGFAIIIVAWVVIRQGLDFFAKEDFGNPLRQAMWKIFG